MVNRLSLLCDRTDSILNKNTMTKKILLILFSAALFGFAQAQNGWVLKTDNDGIKVYTGTTPGSKIKSIKVECTLQTTLSQLAVALLDINTSKQWVYNTKSVVLLKQVSPGDLYYYSEVNVPWPVNNRDFIAHLKLSQNTETKVMTLDAENVPGYMPAKPNVVRIQQSVGKWVATPAGANNVKVEYTLFADPGGNVPAWLINMFITKGPLESFKKLRELLNNQAYNNPRFAFVKN